MTAVFFDIGGVLMPSAVRVSYDRLTTNGRSLPIERFVQLLSDKRILTGPKGTLEILKS